MMIALSLMLRFLALIMLSRLQARCWQKFMLQQDICGCWLHGCISKNAGQTVHPSWPAVCRQVISVHRWLSGIICVTGTVSSVAISDRLRPRAGKSFLPMLIFFLASISGRLLPGQHSEVFQSYFCCRENRNTACSITPCTRSMATCWMPVSVFTNTAWVSARQGGRY